MADMKVAAMAGMKADEKAAEMAAEMAADWVGMLVDC